ncbi:replication restart helicase PriA [Mycoplasma sp. P36-A1]|uniref:replication restart helicase PriA n=1 Tax=Mycoplasma sp. P36-A1 TaxID=3252900 RepID=UPI003C2C6161
MYTINILVQYKNILLNQEYTYYSKNEVKKYSRVQINFNNKEIIGLVINVEEGMINNKKDFKIKEITKVIDQTPLINDELYNLALFMQKKYLVSKMDAITTMLPSKMRLDDKTKVSQVVWIYYQESNEVIKGKTLKAKEYLKNSEKVLLKDFTKLFSSYCANSLVEKGYAKKIKHNKLYSLVDQKQKDFKKLNNLQEKAYNAIIETKQTTSLLHGITGSGKTEVYLHLAKHYVSNNKSVLILVPEITLTLMMQQRFASRFENNIAILHSKLTDNAKYQEYQKIVNNDVKVIVGTRSAIYAPIKNLGLIIIDEEHDSSFKQNNNVTYNTIDIAQQRALYHNAKIVLGSATPSMNTFTKAYTKQYNYVSINQRVNNLNLPKVNIVDLNYENIANIVSDTTLNKMQEFLDNSKQIIVLLNRRGYYNFFQCRSCKEIIKCPNCDLPLTYHKKENTLICHHCDYKITNLQECPTCHSKEFKKIGFGTQRIEEYIQEKFNSYNVARIDQDSVKNIAALETIINNFNEQKSDILIGTQMIAKGLDFANADLVVVLNIDSSLSFNQYDAAYNAFVLLVQVQGRSGRASGKGEVVIETFMPQDYVIQKAINHDYLGFYSLEMSKRRQSNNPPYYYLALLTFSSIDEKQLEIEVEKAEQSLKKYYNNQDNIIVEREYYILHKVANTYKKAIIVKYKDYDIIYKQLYKLKMIYAKNRNIKLQIDTEYY